MEKFNWITRQKLFLRKFFVLPTILIHWNYCQNAKCSSDICQISVFHQFPFQLAVPFLPALTPFLLQIFVIFPPRVQKKERDCPKFRKFSQARREREQRGKNNLFMLWLWTILERLATLSAGSPSLSLSRFEKTTRARGNCPQGENMYSSSVPSCPFILFPLFFLDNTMVESSDRSK